MTRASDESEERPVKGGRAAERLRQFLAARFGDEAPAIPPDEKEPEGGASGESAGKPPAGTDSADRPAP